MAQINAAYAVAMAYALPGQVSDTSAYNIDGACVVDDEAAAVIKPGYAVTVKSVDAEGHKVIQALGAKAYGVAIRSHAYTENVNGEMVYIQGGGINVMTHGRIWVVTKDEAAQTFDTPVKLTAAGEADAEAGTVATGWTYTGQFTVWGEGSTAVNLAEIQITQNAPIPAAAPAE